MNGPTAGIRDRKAFAYVWGAGASGSYGIASGRAEAYGLHTNTNYDVYFGLFDDDDEFEPGLNTGGWAGASAIKAKAYGMLGDRDLGLSADGNGDIASAKAGAALNLGWDDDGGFQANANAEALASVASGDVLVGFHLFGHEISIGVHRHAVAIGGSAEVGYDHEDGLTAKAHAAALFGGGLELNIK